MKRSMYIIGWFLSIIATTVFAINTINTGYQVIAHQATTIDAHSVCVIVGNSWTSDIFVPTKTIGERSAFRANTPSNIHLDTGKGICGENTMNVCDRWTVDNSVGPTCIWGIKYRWTRDCDYSAWCWVTSCQYEEADICS